MLLIGLVTLLVISACSPLVNPGVNGTQTKVLLVNVNIDTEYLTGPGQVYQKIGVLAAGQVVEAVGRSPDGNFLLIRDPANSGNLYWINSKNVTVPGNPNDLPVATPIATPTPVGGCPTPIGGGPTPVDCGVAPSTGGCPTPIGGGPTPVDCGVAPPRLGEVQQQSIAELRQQLEVVLRPLGEVQQQSIAVLRPQQEAARRRLAVVPLRLAAEALLLYPHCQS